MSIAPYKTFVAGEVLTAADLNASFTQITNAGISLVSPLTSNLDFNGNSIILDADGDSYINVATDDIFLIHLNGADLFKFDGTVASPVNGIDHFAAATGNRPTVRARGGDTNIGLGLRPQGSTGVVVVEDHNGNEVLKAGVGTASAVNELTVTNAAAGGAPVISATGGDTDIGITLTPKGAGKITASALVAPITLDGTALTASAILTTTEAGAAESIALDLYRDSASPLANDLLESILWSARSSTTVKRTVAKILLKYLDPTNASEDAALYISAIIAGALTDVIIAGPGVQIGAAPTGGDKGAGTLNVATNYFRAGSTMLGPDAIIGATSASPAVTDNGVLYIPTGAGFTLTLPTISTVFSGFRVGVLNQCSSGSCVANRSSSNTITSQGTTGLTSITLPSVGDMVWFIADKTNSVWVLQGKRSFTSGDTASSISTTTTTAHNLGVTPQFYKTVLVNTIANLNYSPGDIVDPSASTTNAGGGFAMLADATNLTVITVAAATALPNKTTFGMASITTADWNIRSTAVVWN